ncbi:hypothetical protein M0G74_08715 [Microbulbifer sp. CAU 1566]|uniref:hypothetical protein n=1 Tax=Microbulbifer sp. CAU 1566 TaxID=2933269 RepID=UPI0020038A9F|nr:hypothetical protein [Microbulbifer sp. CAU 1566]MCK7597352.1 hypothetical protein [Microbulbifer sp. CAU 1566]
MLDKLISKWTRNRSTGKTIYLHAGISKTGTTAIQKYFHVNAEHLRTQGIHYLSSGRAERGESHHLLARTYKRDDRADQLVAEIQEEIALSECQAFVISSEMFEYLGSRQIRQLKDDFHPHEVVLVLYLRYQDQALSSMYNELVKKHACSTTFSKHLEVTPRKALLQYSKMLKPWEQEFGVGNIRVRIFDRERLVGGNVVSDMLSVVGCESAPSDIPVSAANKSVSAVAIRVLALINQHLDYQVDHSANYGEACRLALRLDGLVRREFPLLEHDCNSYFDSDQEYKDFLAFYRADNAVLSQRYLSGKSMVPGSYRPAEVLSDEQLVSILRELVDELGIPTQGASMATIELVKLIAVFWSEKLRNACEQ